MLYLRGIGEGTTEKCVAERFNREDAKARFTARPSFAEVIGVVERMKGEPWVAFRDRRSDWGREFAGLTLAELREEVKAGTPMAFSSAVRRFRERLALEKPLRQLQARAIEQLGDR